MNKEDRRILAIMVMFTAITGILAMVVVIFIENFSK
jgi:hypothetical protein